MGLMGPNGSGKTTLLRLIANEISLDRGTLKRADLLQVAYFDQHRNVLPSDISLRQALSPTGDFIQFRGQLIHVNGWCKRFLFSPDLLDLPLGKLSGGERARIAIAHLMLQPADLLLLDEPTNDLDIPTLETLEESLLDCPGAVVLITHDRFMLERVCNCLLALGDLSRQELFADYAQWNASFTTGSNAPLTKIRDVKEPSVPKVKMSYSEQKEYEQIEGQILKLEKKLKDLTHLLEDERIVKDSAKLSETCKAISLVENQIEQLYLRWEKLEQKKIESSI
jgi:ATP-binding cassette subfamily F protein uup